MKLGKVLIYLIGVLIVYSCSQEKKMKFIVIQNNLDKERLYETIELTQDFLKIESLTHVGIKDLASNELLVTQLVDKDGDGIMDLLLFQTGIGANSEKKFEIVKISEEERPKSKTFCYSRFVPERTDDYAWENNKVAFRVFGPKAQKMVEDGVPGGTLTSGVDAWLKKVEYPIINKWYKKELETPGTYHEDNGEGLDNFHVGVSRGVGGLAAKMDSIFYFSKNYTKWRTIATGPIRTCFYLEVEDWEAAGKTIKESRIISLDLGSNLSRFEIFLEGTEEVSAGLALHEKDGEVSSNNERAWVSYWQPHGSSELGTAIVTTPDYFIEYEKYDVGEKDLSNAYLHMKTKDNSVIYYAGFGWKESGQFNDNQEWENYLNLFSAQINSPLTIKLSP